MEKVNKADPERETERGGAGHAAVCMCKRQTRETQRCLVVTLDDGILSNHSQVMFSNVACYFQNLYFQFVIV